MSSKEEEDTSLSRLSLDNVVDRVYSVTENGTHHQFEDMQSPKSFSSVESLRRNLNVDGFYSASEDEEEDEGSDEEEDSFEPSYGGPWQHEIDRHGRSYVFNRTTGESRWLEDSESPTSPPGAPTPLLSPLFTETPRHNEKIVDNENTEKDGGQTWTPYTDENGYTYYYNESTGVSRWSLPDEKKEEEEKKESLENSSSSNIDIDAFHSELNEAERALADISVELTSTTQLDKTTTQVPSSPPSAATARAHAEIKRLREELRHTKDRHVSDRETFTKQIQEIEMQRESMVSKLRNQLKERDEELRALRGEMVVMELRERNLRSLLILENSSSAPTVSVDNTTDTRALQSEKKPRNHDDDDDNHPAAETPQDEKREVLSS